MVTMIATLKKFYNTVKILYKYNHTNYVKKPAALCGITHVQPTTHRIDIAFFLAL
jgi:hypothetical protein